VGEKIYNFVYSIGKHWLHIMGKKGGGGGLRPWERAFLNHIWTYNVIPFYLGEVPSSSFVEVSEDEDKEEEGVTPSEPNGM
jgi:hypothetical protein